MAGLEELETTQPSRVFEAGRGKVELFDIGPTPLCRVTYEPGWRWSDDWREATRAGELCQVRHAGVVLSGHLHLVMTDGSTMDVAGGDAYDIPPGHDGWVVGDEPWIAIDSLAQGLFAILEERGVSVDRVQDREGR